MKSKEAAGEFAGFAPVAELIAPTDVGSMAELRVQIDAMDRALMVLLAQRWAYTERAADLKAREGIAAAAPSRVRAVLENMRGMARAQGLDEDMVAAMWQIMIDKVIAGEQRVIGTEGRDK